MLLFIVSRNLISLVRNLRQLGTQGTALPFNGLKDLTSNGNNRKEILLSGVPMLV